MNRSKLVGAFLDASLPAALAAANLVSAPGDLGWLTCQPSPWVVLPVWFGLRHGSVAGVLVAVGAFGAMAASHSGLHLNACGEFCGDHRAFLYWLILLGFLCGEVNGRWAKAASLYRGEAARFAAKLEKARKAVRQLRALHDDPAQNGILRDTEFSSLDANLRSLSLAPAEHIPRLLLLTANLHGVSEAALYATQETEEDSSNNTLERRAFLGPESRFPKTLDSNSNELVSAALEARKLVNVPNLQHPEGEEVQHSYLIAAPLCTAAGKVVALLLVAAVPLSTSKLRLLDVLTLIAMRGGHLLTPANGKESPGEMAAKLRRAAGPKQILGPAPFETILKRSADSYCRTGKSAELVILQLPQAPASLQTDFEKALLPVLRASDFITKVQGSPNLILLLAQTTKESAPAVIKRCQAAWKDTFFPLTATVKAVEGATELSALLEKPATVPDARSQDRPVEAPSEDSNQPNADETFPNRQLFPTKRAWADMALLSFGIAASNFLLARHDPGFLEIQPTPYLILPVLAGARYGVSAGLWAGFIAFLAVASGGSLRPGGVWQEFFTHHFGVLFWGTLLGAVCGVIQAESQRERKVLLNEKEDMGQRHEEVENEATFLRRAKDELDRAVALRNREHSTLDTALRWLSASTAPQLPRNTLLLLNRQARVTDAALYYLDRQTCVMRREALLGRENHLPTQLHFGELPIAQMALQKNRTVTVPELLQIAAANGTKAGAAHKHLAAIPLLRCEGEPFGMLLITGMPFLGFTPKTLGLIELICKWAASLMELAESSGSIFRLVSGLPESRKICSAAFFTNLVRFSAEAFKTQRSVSTLVLFCVPDAPVSFQETLESNLMRRMRSGDYASDLALGFPHLAVLLPLTGKRSSNIFIERTEAGWRNRQYAVKTFSAPIDDETALQTLVCKAMQMEPDQHENHFTSV